MPRRRPGKRLIPIIDRLTGDRVFRWVRTTSGNLNRPQNRRESVTWSSCQSTGVYSIARNQDSFAISRRRGGNAAFQVPVLVDYVQPQLRGGTHTPALRAGASVEPVHYTFAPLNLPGRTISTGSTSTPALAVGARVGSQLGIIFNRPCSETRGSGGGRR